ncbi:hypothetical protein DH96_00635 [Candidatus Phytoplasma oryzae]|uniref:Uncharacterized protein n=1 Tax=Candidatus Phytoplasma oryzae TaxID=203274 RepID=A0A328IL92_9MOLU|nr:hypothetical protein [Candidatus Phytoplasma oryzae]RAM58044.1 hypothetical protein DH96_00635 [Candidatus Phytoplasma oryzae]
MTLNSNKPIINLKGVFIKVITFILSIIILNIFVNKYHVRTEELEIRKNIHFSSLLNKKVKPIEEKNIQLQNENEILTKYPKEIVQEDGTKEYYSLKNDGNIIKREFKDGSIEEFDPKGIKFKEVDINNKVTLFKGSSYTAKDFKKQGFSLENIKTAGFTNKELLESGCFTISEFQQSNIPLNDINDDVPLSVLKNHYAKNKLAQKYTMQELADAQVTLTDLKNDNVSVSTEMITAYTLDEVAKLYTATALKTAQVPLTSEIVQKYKVPSLKQAGFTANDFKQGQIELADIKDDFDISDVYNIYEDNQIIKAYGQTKFSIFKNSP